MELLKEMLADRGIQLNQRQMDQFNVYYQLLTKWNRSMNLTAITGEKEVILKHFYDSVTPAFYCSFEAPLSLCDVGSGAGFPGIPLKIVYPDIELTVVDALKKRLTFLEAVVASLELGNVRLCHDRAETFGRRKEMRESFDRVTARAVANLSVLAEYCLPLVRPNGMFLALKGAFVGQEVKLAENAIRLLGGKRRKTVLFDLPEGQGRRSIVWIDKMRPTPKKYPRKAGTPSKSPL